MQETGKAKTMSDTYGQTSLTPFAQYDHDTQSWKTSAVTSLWALPMSSLTLPKSGGLVNGELFERPMLELPTDASASSSLPTPHAGLGERGRDGVYPNPKGQQDLQHTLATLLATPRSRLSNNDDVSKDRGKHNLEDQISHLLPTPLTSDCNPPASDYGQEDRLQLRDINVFLPTPKATSNESQQNLAKYGPNLGMALMPDQYDWSGIVGRLLPTQIGESTPQQSPDGKMF
jgi:hypothetical protein